MRVLFLIWVGLFHSLWLEQSAKTLREMTLVIVAFKIARGFLELFDLCFFMIHNQILPRSHNRSNPQAMHASARAIDSVRAKCER